MQLVLVHYHLNKGGVTQSILNHLHALSTLPADRQPSAVLILYSGQRTGWPEDAWDADGKAPFPVTLAAVPELEYDSTFAPCDPEALEAAMSAAIASAGFDSSGTLLHVHNHSLGKNASLPGALRRLAVAGFRLLLQTHDFAEDFRPANYRHLMRATKSFDPADLAAKLYPASGAIHYAVLNGRDHGLLSAAGMTSEQLHTLPNPVLSFTGRPPRDEARERVFDKLDLPPETRFVVYPVRGIRRKNVGEMLLHAALTGDNSCYALTLAPANPVEVPPFVRWTELAEELGLNCRFDIGGDASTGAAGVNFLDALAASDALITTSVAEGFGMVFLESWLAGGVLVGRDLPEITADFRAAGLQLDLLAAELLVPTAWLDTEALAGHAKELHHWTCQDYGLGELAEGASPLFGEEVIDFAVLPAPYQREVIRQVAKDPEETRAKLCELNPGLESQLTSRSDDHRSMIEDNADRVRAEYSPAAIGGRLSQVYEAVMACDPAGEVTSLPEGRSILDYFLTLERLRPVRLET